MKFATFTLIVTTAAVGAGVNAAHAEERSFDLSGFNAVSASAGVDVDVRVGPDYEVTAETTAMGFERLELRVDGDELIISRKSRGFTWKRAPKITVDVTLPDLVSLDVSSGAGVDVSGVDATTFDVEVSSGGSAEVSGKCEKINANVSSGGDLEAETLECDSATIDASSGGAASVYASQSLIADASSGASIDVFGSPDKTSIDKSSGGGVSIK